MFNETTFREMLFSSSENVLPHDLINLLYYKIHQDQSLSKLNLYFFIYIYIYIYFDKGIYNQSEDQ